MLLEELVNIIAARAVYREFVYIFVDCLYMFGIFVDLLYIFCTFRLHKGDYRPARRLSILT